MSTEEEQTLRVIAFTEYQIVTMDLYHWLRLQLLILRMRQWSLVRKYLSCHQAEGAETETAVLS